MIHANALIVSLILIISLDGIAQEILDLGVSTDVMEVGSSKQLFIDDALIEFSRNVEFTMHTPYSTGEVLVKADEAYEKGGFTYLYSSILRDPLDSKIKLWYDYYRPNSEEDPYDHDRHVAYAESHDGIHFTKPLIGLHKLKGSRENNVVIPGVIGGSSVWLDPHAPHGDRFKTQAKVYPSGKFYMHSSPDGINWRMFADIDPKGDHDTQTIIFWDQNQNSYLFYSRHFLERDGIRERGVRRAVIDHKFSDIKNTGLVIWPDFTDKSKYSDVMESGNTVDYYGATVFPYENVYILLAQAFWHWIPETEFQGTGEPGMRDVRLAVSRDSREFQRVGGRKAFMTPGPLGRFDSRQIWVLPQPVVMDDEIWLYYCGVNWDRAGRTDPLAPGGKKAAAISRAILRLDGFVSLDASYSEQGEIITRPMMFSGEDLEINANTGAGGSIRVEILDIHGQVIPGFTKEECGWIVGNSVRHKVNWSGSKSLASLAGQTIRLRFVMRDCELYAFQFK